MNNRFTKGSGCFKCQDCGKTTRNTGQDNLDYCEPCCERMGHENYHADSDFENDDCGEDDCPVKHYTKEQRWWVK